MTGIVARRRALLDSLGRLVRTPSTNEANVQALIGDAWWLFGGRYVGVADRRNLAVLDQHDIPLMGADGTLHIIELKGPNIPKLVHRHRNHYIVGREVHEAVSQAMNYLRTLDDDGAGLTTKYRNEFGEEYDMRRVLATVVIGHPDFVSDASEQQVHQTIRSYNSHLARVQVMTYKELHDAANRALSFDERIRGGPEEELF